MNIFIPADANVEVLSIKLNIVCKNNPQHAWGTYLNHDGSLPSTWNICIKCFLNNRANTPDNLTNNPKPESYRLNDAK